MFILDFGPDAPNKSNHRRFWVMAGEYDELEEGIDATDPWYELLEYLASEEWQRDRLVGYAAARQRMAAAEKPKTEQNFWIGSN